jgi:hypothetical protein
LLAVQFSKEAVDSNPIFSNFSTFDSHISKPNLGPEHQPAFNLKLSTLVFSSVERFSNAHQILSPDLTMKID